MSTTAKVLIAVLAAVIVLGICGVVAFMLFMTPSGPEAAATSTITPVVDDSWERVRTAGKIVVGTSADYPPFEYMTADSKIDGFDIALMDEIGRRLGVEVEYRNFAFDGLGSALQVRQIDAAIAAISVTPEREALVDFSSVYFVGEDGILADEDSDITNIGSEGELASSRIGVQRGTVYADWVQTSLVDTGRMPADNLFVYEKAEDAVRDLQEGRLELVVLDAQPAQAFASEGGVKVVARGLNRQHFALALPKGAASLKAEIDRILTELHNEGIVAELAQKYLNLDQLLPTPTPAPTSTPGPGPGCMDGLALVEHLSHDDENMAAPPEMKPGQAFTKGWRVQNTGTCTWDSSYELVYAGGNDPAAGMGGQPVAIEGEVAPGSTYDIEVDLVAPLRPGTYQGFWQMANGTGQAPSAGSGQAFGERLPAGITVLAGPTATPAPTQTPAPGIIFTVGRTNIKAGECVVFAWKVENVQAVFFYAEGERWQDNGVAGEGRQQECPPVTTTYYLRVVKPDNSVEVRQISIYVEPAPDAPQITRFTVDPPNQIEMGQCVDIRWTVEGNASEVTVTSSDIVLWENAPLKGSLQDCPAGPATIAYGVKAVGPGGASQRQENINVVEPAVKPQPTAAPDLPVIYSFTVTPNQIAIGECVAISWSVGGGTSVGRILRNGVMIIGHGDYVGQEMDCLDEPSDYLYRLEAYNLVGEMAFEERSVIVTEDTASNPLAGTSWIATAYYDGAAMTTVLEGTSLTALFGEGGQLNGSAGCNTYSAHYLVDGNTLSITAPGSTSTYCEEPTGIMEQETAFLANLELAATYSIEGGELYVLDASGRVMLEFVQHER